MINARKEMGTSKIVVDCSRFPVVIQTMQAGYGVEDLDQMLREYEGLLKGAERYTIIVNFAELPSMNAAHRKRMAAWWLPRRELVRQKNILSVIVVESTIVRGMLTALYWLVQPPNPQKVAGTFAEAVKLCVEALERENIPINAAVKALRDHPVANEPGSGAGPVA
jgi:hypothetical protein